jgi:hypothetical protein
MAGIRTGWRRALLGVVLSAAGLAVLVGLVFSAAPASAVGTYPAPEPPAPIIVPVDPTPQVVVPGDALAVRSQAVQAPVPVPEVDVPEPAAVPASTAVAAVPREDKTPSQRPRFVAMIPRPSEISWNLGHVGANASIAFAMVLLLGLPAELLNSSLKARAALRPARVRLPLLGRFERRLNRMPSPLLLVAFSAAGAVVHSQLEPEIRFDRTSMLFLGALTMAFIVVTGVLELVRIPYLHRRHQVSSHLTMFPRAFLVAVVLVIVSRLTGFQPGFVFGITCGLAVTGRLKDEDEGRSIALACAVLLVVAAIGWIAWIPASTAASAAHPGAVAILLDSFLATLWVTGLQVVLFGLLPFRFLYGEKVLHWSRTGWLALYGTAVFLFMQTLFHPQAAKWGGFSEHAIRLLVVTSVVMFLASIAFWLWVRRRSSSAEPLQALSIAG